MPGARSRGGGCFSNAGYLFKSSGYLGVEILPNTVNGDEKVVSDWREYFPSEKRCVRVNEILRFGLLALDDEDGDVLVDEGALPDDVALSKPIITAMHFMDGDFILRDDADSKTCLEGYVEDATKAERLWTGLTSFWPEGVDPQAYVLLEATYLPREKTALLELMAGGDINRDSVPLCHLSAIGLETEAIINC